MRVAIIGAGPAGLYFAYTLKRRRPAIGIEVYEQNPARATFGFGVAFSDRALEFLREQDAGLFAALHSELVSWGDSIVVHRGRRVRIDGMGYSGIGRLALLEVLRRHAARVGIEPRYDTPIGDVVALGDADLIVGADGIHSRVRAGHESEFGTSISEFSNRFAWFGTSQRFDALTHTFVEADGGHFNAHHHPHAADMSTFVVEMDKATFFRGGFDTMPADEARALCERVFAGTLDGHALISNKSIWRQFPRVSNERWSVGNRVLIGDAAHTAHFSIGSGTRLAMEDAFALADAIATAPGDLAAALAAYQNTRKPIVAKLVAAANASAQWYERFGEHMQLAPMDFAMSYITRSGRVDIERLRKLAPGFVAEYEASR